MTREKISTEGTTTTCSYSWPSHTQTFGPALIQHICKLLGVLHSGDVLARKVGRVLPLEVCFRNLGRLTPSMTFEVRIALSKNQLRLLRRLGGWKAWQKTRCEFLIAVLPRSQSRGLEPDGIQYSRLELLVHQFHNVVEALWVDHFQITPGLSQSRNCFSLFLITCIRKNLLARQTDSFAICSAPQFCLFAVVLRREQRLRAGIFIQYGKSMVVMARLFRQFVRYATELTHCRRAIPKTQIQTKWLLHTRTPFAGGSFYGRRR